MAIDMEDRMELALRASNEGIWEWEAETNELEVSTRVLRFLCCSAEELPNFVRDFDSVIHPDDRELFQKKLARILERKGKLFAVEPRLKTNKGDWKWFRIRGIPVRDEEGKVTRMVGSMIDISKRKKAEAALDEERRRLEILLENIPMNVYFKDEKSRFVMVNSATAKKLGAPSVSHLLGKTDHDFFDDKHADYSRAHEKEIMETGQGQIEKLEQEKWPGKEDTWVLTTKLPWRSGPKNKIVGTFGVTNDVTELVRTQKHLKQLADQLRKTNKRIEEDRHLLRLVIDNVPLHVYFKDRESRFVLVNKGTAEWFGEKTVDDVLGKHDRDYFREEHWAKAEADENQVMESGQPLVDQLERETWAKKEDTYAMTSKFPWQDSDGNIKGTFGVSSDVSGMIRTQRQLASLAEDLGQRNDLMNEELAMAREIQQALIPATLPKLAFEGRKLAFHHRYRPASELAGDFLEVIPLSESTAGFLVSDVMGHGVRAALVVSMLRGLIEKKQAEARDPGQFLQLLNHGLHHLLDQAGVTMFASAVYGVVDLERNELSLGIAGHPAPILIEKNGPRQFRLEKGVRGPALGVIADAHYGCARISLHDVRRLICFTDGIFEVENAKGEEFGTERLMEILARPGNLDSLLDAAQTEALAHSGGEHFDDDVCLLGFALDEN